VMEYLPQCLQNQANLSQTPTDPSDDKSQNLSILERMPNQILSKIFLMAHNLFLLDKCHKGRGALSADI
jgi:hypothetical protein